MNSSSIQKTPARLRAFFETLPELSFTKGNAYAIAKLGSSSIGAPERKSAVSLRGIVVEALRRDTYFIVLDQLGFTSQSFLKDIREVIGWASTPIIAVARSAHMEDVGFLLSLFPGRRDRFELRNFDPETAARFLRQLLEQNPISADNVAEFVEGVVKYSEGNPGAMISMLQLADNSKYRSGNYIKIMPLYIDFKLAWGRAQPV